MGMLPFGNLGFHDQLLTNLLPSCPLLTLDHQVSVCGSLCKQELLEYCKLIHEIEGVFK